jgi:dienelactone hydrolase
MERRTLMKSLALAAGGQAGTRRRELYGLLGELPARNRRISVESLGVDTSRGFHLERLVLDVNGLEKAPAYFVKPLGAKGKRPALLFNHWHGGEYKLGKDEMLRPKKDIPSWAEAIAAEGYAALCLDMWAFGERSTRTEMDLFKDFLWHGRVLWGMMVYDSLRGLDYLMTRPDVDPARVGTIGMSMGSTMAWWVAALDERVRVCVDICCLTDFDALMRNGNLKGHGVYYYVPGLLKHFSAAQINALIVPRPHLSLAGNLDSLTPPEGLDRIDRELRDVYAKAGHPERWKLFRQDVAHVETPQMRAEALEFLRGWLAD